MWVVSIYGFRDYGGHSQGVVQNLSEIFLGFCDFAALLFGHPDIVFCHGLHRMPLVLCPSCGRCASVKGIIFKGLSRIVEGDSAFESFALEDAGFFAGSAKGPVVGAHRFRWVNDARENNYPAPLEKWTTDSPS
jgi:hypothetical protein